MELQRCFVLHRRAYRNTSLLLELFAEQHGRLPLVARGGAKNTASALLQPFVPLRMSWRGRGEVKTVHHIEADGYRLAPLAGQRLYCGLYLNELLMRLLPRDEEHDALFTTYAAVLSELQHTYQPDWLLRRFELNLLRELGYALDTSISHDGIPIESDACYEYAPGEGLIRTSRASSSSVRGATLIALQHESCQHKALRLEAKRLLRTMIDHLLDYKPIKTRELFR